MKTSLYSRTLALALAHCSLTVSGLCDEAGITPEKPTSETVYVIYTKGGSESMGGGIVVTNLTKEKFLGIKCLVGRGLTGYTKSVKIRVPVESAVMLMEFKNKKEWESAVKKYSDLDHR